MIRVLQSKTIVVTTRFPSSTRTDVMSGRVITEIVIQRFPRTLCREEMT